jgi:hypothetical protein
MGKHHGIQRIAREGDRGVITGYGLLAFSDWAYVHMETDGGETVCLDYDRQLAECVGQAAAGLRAVARLAQDAQLYFHDEAGADATMVSKPPGPGGKPKSWALSHYNGPSYGRDST